MKVVYTNQSLDSLQDCMKFLLEVLEIPTKKVSEIKKLLLDRADNLELNPLLGQKEEYLHHLGKDHRRLVETHFKIIYLIEGERIYITDFFDTRQDPEKMKG